MPFYIFVSGSVGVGKSTIIQFLSRTFKKNVFYVKEFIDFDPQGEKKLNDYLANKDTALQFQHYILDCYRMQFDSFQCKYSDICLIERHPEENLIFVKNQLTTKELDTLETATKDLLKRYNIPSLSEIDEVIFNFDSPAMMENVAKLLDFLNERIQSHSITEKNKKKTCVRIRVECSEETQMKRIRSRGRGSDNYYLQNKEYLKTINKLYSN